MIKRGVIDDKTPDEKEPAMADDKTAQDKGAGTAAGEKDNKGHPAGRVADAVKAASKK